MARPQALAQPGFGLITPPGRTSETVRRTVFNVKDYSAKGDGSTDDTAAIQAAVTAGVGAVVIVPPGTYKTSLAITGLSALAGFIARGVTWTGTGSTTGLNVFSVSAEGNTGSWVPRFVVEYTPGSPEVDIDFRGASVEFGQVSSALDPGATRINMYAPTGETGTALNIFQPNDTNVNTPSIALGRLGHINCAAFGRSSTFYSVFTAGEANPRFRIQEVDTGGGGGASAVVGVRFGPGGATALDTELKYIQAGLLSLGQPLQTGALEVGFDSTLATLRPFVRTTSTYRDLNIDAATFKVRNQTTTRFSTDATGIGFFGVTPAARTGAYTLNAGATSRNLASGAVLTNVEQTLRQVITDLQAYGLLQ